MVSITYKETAVFVSTFSSKPKKFSETIYNVKGFSTLTIWTALYKQIIK